MEERKNIYNWRGENMAGVKEKQEKEETDEVDEALKGREGRRRR